MTLPLFSEKGLCAFDCLLIFVEATLKQEEIKFAQQALHFHQAVAFVRSRCDEDLENMKRDEEIEEITQEEVNKYVVTSKSTVFPPIQSFKTPYRSSSKNSKHFIYLTMVMLR